ncbi:MAG: hypothetical protein AAGM22_33800, partial [Acidobacteriota bacterium]
MSGARGPQSPPRNLAAAPIVVFFALWLGVPSLIVGFFLQPMVPGGWWAILAAFSGFAIPMRVLIRGLRGLSYPSAAVRLLVLRPFWYAMLCLPLLAGFTLAGALMGLVAGDPLRFGQLAMTSGGALFAVAGIFGYIGARRLVVRELEVTLPRLGQAFDGLRVAQISDLHVGPHSWRFFLSRVERTVRKAE